jgi:hypothetical protein
MTRVSRRTLSFISAPHPLGPQMKDHLAEIFDAMRDNPDIWLAVLAGEQIRHSADAREGLAAFREKCQSAWQRR